MYITARVLTHAPRSGRTIPCKAVIYSAQPRTANREQISVRFSGVSVGVFFTRTELPGNRSVGWLTANRKIIANRGLWCPYFRPVGQPRTDIFRVILRIKHIRIALTEERLLQRILIIPETNLRRRSRYTYFANLAGRRALESSVGHFGIIWFRWLKRKPYQTEIKKREHLCCLESLFTVGLNKSQSKSGMAAVQQQIADGRGICRGMAVGGFD